MEIICDISNNDSMTSIVSTLTECQLFVKYVLFFFWRSSKDKGKLTAQQAQISASAQRISDNLPLP